MGIKRKFRVARTDRDVHETIIELDEDEIARECGPEPFDEDDVYTMAEEAADDEDDVTPWTFVESGRDYQCLGEVKPEPGDYTPAIVSYLTGYADGLIAQMDRSLPFDHWFEADGGYRGYRIHLITPKDDGYENFGPVEAWAYGVKPGAVIQLEVKR